MRNSTYIKSTCPAIVVFLAALGFAYLNSGWLLSEGYWGIDEGIFLSSIERAHEMGRKAGWLAEVAAAYDPKLRNYGFNYVMYGWFWTKLFGSNEPWTWRIPHLLYQATFIACIWGGTRRLGGGRFGSFVAAAFVMLMNASSLLPDMQSSSANWYRPFASDTHGAMPLAVCIFAFASMIYSKGRQRIAWLSLGVVTFALAQTTKASFLYLGGVPFVAFLLSMTMGSLKQKRTRQILIVLVPLVIITAFHVYFFVKPMLGAGESFNYDVKPSFAPTQILNGLWFFSIQIMDTGFWLVGYLIIWGLWRTIKSGWAARRANTARASRFILIACLPAAVFGGMLLQSTWPVLLPRYTILFSPPLAVFLGVMSGWISKDLRGAFIGQRSRMVFILSALCAVGGVVALYLPTSRGYGKLALFAASVVAPLAILFLLAKISRWPVRPSLIPCWSGILLGSFLITLCFDLAKFVEDRDAFKAEFRGLNRIHETAKLIPKSSVVTHIIPISPPGEFFWTSIRILNEDGRGDLIAGDLFTPGKVIERPADIIFNTYPHPPSGEWIPKATVDGYLTPWCSTGDTFSGLVSIPNGTPGLAIPLPSVTATVLLGMIVVRVDSSTLNSYRNVVAQVKAKNGAILAESAFEGVCSPYQPTNELPIVFHPAPKLEPGTAYEVGIRYTENLTFKRAPVRWFEMASSLPCVMMMTGHRKDGSSTAALPGLSAFLCTPWAPPHEAMPIVDTSSSKILMHFETPGARIRFLTQSKGWGYHPRFARWVRHEIPVTHVLLP